MSHLSPRQQNFVEEYLRDGNGSRAAIAAGYGAAGAPVAASRLLKNVHVAAAVSTRQCELAARHDVDRDRVVGELLQAIELAKGQGDAAAMIRGWAEIARLLGYYRQVQSTKIHVNITAKRLIGQLETMTDTELLREVQRGETSVSARERD